VQSDASVHEALSLMSSYELSELPVIDGDELKGTLRENKLMAAVIDDRSVVERSIAPYMERAVPILDAHDDIQAAITRLRDVPMVVISEFGKLTGVVTRHDVLEYL
jgi:cystathionine beta-synthase